VLEQQRHVLDTMKASDADRQAKITNAYGASYPYSPCGMAVSIRA